MLGLVTPDRRFAGIRRAIEILKLLDYDDLRKSRPRRAAMVVQERGAMAGLPYRFFWKDDITTIQERNTRHQKMIWHVVQYPYSLRCTEEQRRHIESVLRIDNGTTRYRSELPRRQWREQKNRKPSKMETSITANWPTSALTRSHNGLLQDIASLMRKTSSLGQAGLSRDQVAESIMYYMPPEYSVEELGEDIDHLVKTGCLREVDGILTLPLH